MQKLLISFLSLILVFSFSLFSSDIITPKANLNPLQKNKEIVKDFYTAFSKNDTALMEKLLASKYGVQDSNVAFDSTYSKYDAFSKNLLTRAKSIHAALPEFTLSIFEMLAEENKVLARIQITGIQKGKFLGVEAVNKPVVIKMFALFTLEDGKITHINEAWNEFGVMKQIGYIIL